MTRGQDGSLLLSCIGLSPTIACQFVLAHRFLGLIDTIQLPDPNDRHVVAAAITSGASLIVTFNLKDFPENILLPLEIEVQHPDEFISHLIDLNTAKVCEAASKHRKSLKNPPKTADEYLDTLLKQGLVETAKQLRNWKIAL